MRFSQSRRLEVPFQGAKWSGETSPCVLTWWQGWGCSVGSTLLRALIPFMRTLISWPNKFPKASPTITITFGVRISTYEPGARDTNVQTIENPLRNVSCVPQSKFIAVAEIGWGLPANWRPSACLPGQMSGKFLRELQFWDDSLCLLFPFSCVCALLVSLQNITCSVRQLVKNYFIVICGSVWIQIKIHSPFIFKIMPIENRSFIFQPDLANCQVRQYPLPWHGQWPCKSARIKSGSLCFYTQSLKDYEHLFSSFFSGSFH